MRTTTDLIAKEGIKTVLYTVIALIAFMMLDWGFLSFLASLFLISSLIFFYNPEREAEENDDLAVVSPLEGKVKNIVVKKDTIAVEIENSVIDPHLIRSPLDITAAKSSVKRGLFLFSSNENREALGERGRLEFDSQGRKFSLELLSGYIKFPISFYTDREGVAKRSKRIGFFGGGDGVFHMPKKTDLKISIGDNLRAGETLIGFLR